MRRFKFDPVTIAAIIVMMLISSVCLADSPKVLRMQTSYPGTTPTFENFQFWAERVNAMAGGRLKIEVLPAGAIVPAFEVLDAVHKKAIDGGQSAPSYWVGKIRAAALFGPAPGGPFGMDWTDYIGWIYDGGGLQLYNEMYQEKLKRNVIPIPMTTATYQPLGWFKSPVKSWEDLKGRKCRETGLTAEVFSKSGMATVNMPGGEIVPSGERGVIDCGEFAGPYEDMKMGFQTVWKYYYLPSMHEPSTVLELLINGDVWKSLTPDLQEIIKSAAMEATFRSQTTANKRNADALVTLKNDDKVNIERTPDDIMVKILESWDQIAKAESEKDQFFKKVYDSQRAYAQKVVPAKVVTNPPYSFAANYYWGKTK